MLVCWRANKDSDTPRNGPENAPPITIHRAFGFAAPWEIVEKNSFLNTVIVQITKVAVIMRMKLPDRGENPSDNPNFANTNPSA